MHETGKADDFTDLTFEQALEELEVVVRTMETGELPLHETTALFERGVRLANHCTGLLSQAELKITRINTAYGEPGGVEPEGPAEAER